MEQQPLSGNSNAQQPSAGNPPTDQPAPSQTAAVTVQQRVYVVEQATPETIGIDNVRKTAAGYFSAAGKVGAMLGVVKPEEITIVTRTAVFRPYWKVVGGNAYRFSRVHNHTFQVERDVESVVLMQNTVIVMPAPQLQQLIMERATNSSNEYGAVEGSGEATSDTRSKAMGGPPVAREGRVELQNLRENALYMYVGKFLFDGVQGTESKETYDALKNKGMVAIDEDALRGRGTLVSPSFTREQVVDEVSRRLSRMPTDMAGQPTEHQFVIGELSLIYIPYYEFTFEYKGKTRTARLDGMTGKMEET